jgi:hypothetical protein
MGDRHGAYRVLVGKAVRNRPLERPRYRWEDNIKMGLQEVRWGAWAGLCTQDRDRWWAVVNVMMNPGVP